MDQRKSGNEKTLKCGNGKAYRKSVRREKRQIIVMERIGEEYVHTTKKKKEMD